MSPCTRTREKRWRALQQRVSERAQTGKKKSIRDKETPQDLYTPDAVRGSGTRPPHDVVREAHCSDRTCFGHASRAAEHPRRDGRTGRGPARGVGSVRDIDTPSPPQPAIPHHGPRLCIKKGEHRVLDGRLSGVMETTLASGRVDGFISLFPFGRWWWCTKDAVSAKGGRKGGVVVRVNHPVDGWNASRMP